MKFVLPSVTIIKQEPGLEGMYKHIEKAMRVCYKSEDKITEDSYKKMLDLAKANKHHSVLEHGTVYLKIPVNYKDTGYIENDTAIKYVLNNYSKVKVTGDYYYVSSNYRVLVENDWLDDLKYICEPTEYHEKRVTCRVITSIAVSRQWNRHRSLSVSESSTRYCNFSLDKFGNELTFILPSWAFEQDGECTVTDVDYSELAKLSEKVYLKMIERGHKPQEARDSLLVSTKTEVIYTGFVSDWKRFFKLRCRPNAHPDIQFLATMLRKEMT